MIVYHHKIKKYEKEKQISTEFPFQEEFIEAMIKLLDSAGLPMIQYENQQSNRLMNALERDKDKKPYLLQTFKDDLEYKKNKIEEMINYVEKKMVKKAPKYFAEVESFPLRSEDFIKYNCISVTIEFLKNCKRLKFSDRLVSLIQNLFDKLKKEVSRCYEVRKLDLGMNVISDDEDSDLKLNHKKSEEYSRQGSMHRSDSTVISATTNSPGLGNS